MEEFTFSVGGSFIPPEEGVDDASSDVPGVPVEFAGRIGGDHISGFIRREFGFGPDVSAGWAKERDALDSSCEISADRDCRVSEKKVAHSITRVWAEGEGESARVLDAR